MMRRGVILILALLLLLTGCAVGGRTEPDVPQKEYDTPQIGPDGEAPFPGGGTADGLAAFLARHEKLRVRFSGRVLQIDEWDGQRLIALSVGAEDPLLCLYDPHLITWPVYPEMPMITVFGEIGRLRPVGIPCIFVDRMEPGLWQP